MGSALGLGGGEGTRAGESCGGDRRTRTGERGDARLPGGGARAAEEDGGTAVQAEGESGGGDKAGRRRRVVVLGKPSLATVRPDLHADARRESLR